jgi:LAO/AO transport system kinase
MSTASPSSSSPRPPLPTEPGLLLEMAGAGDRVALARLLSHVERGGDTATAVAELAYRSDVPYTVGLTGAPGSGKSTLTDGLITAVRGGWPAVDGGAAGPVPQVAVLAVDPTSPFSGGAILGDRVRMSQHALDPTVFIRSMATRGHLGGLSLAVPDAVRLLGAAGIGVVIIETVGVGQMEVEIASAADTTVVVVTPGWGDSMQANKAGLLEVADVFVINKADRPGVREARRDLEQMLDLARPGAWRPEIVDTTATAAEGVDELWGAVARHRAHLLASGQLATRRADRIALELRRVLLARTEVHIDELVASEEFATAVKALTAGELDPYHAADRLLAD